VGEAHLFFKDLNSREGNFLSLCFFCFFNPTSFALSVAGCVRCVSEQEPRGKVSEQETRMSVDTCGQDVFPGRDGNRPETGGVGQRTASDAEEERFLGLCERIRQECFSDGQDEGQKAEEAKIAESVLGALRRQFDAPPTAAIEVVLLKNCVDSKAREIIFFPQPEDMDFWPLLLSHAPEGAPKDHPQNKALVCTLPVFYLRHSKDWALCRPFILAGGLAALSDLLVHDNLYLRSQALESFSRLTDQCDEIDWLDTSDHNGQCRLRLFELSQGTLVPNLIHNSKGSYPGGSFTALRCLAFFLSWLRHLYTKEKVLYLRQAVLDAFQEWQALEDKSAEEKKLAKTLFEDFGRWPSIEDKAAKGAAGPEGKTQDGAVLHVGGAEWQEARVQEIRGSGSAGTEAPAQSRSEPGGQAQSERAGGHAAPGESGSSGGAGYCVASVAARGGAAGTSVAREGGVGESAGLQACRTGEGLGREGTGAERLEAGTRAEEKRTAVKEGLKAQGNGLLKAGDAPGAERKYSEALELAPDDVLLYCNRALVRLQLGSYASALADCDQVGLIATRLLVAGAAELDCA
jgi:tetratricopeptide (TPR) repeat protein